MPTIFLSCYCKNIKIFYNTVYTLTVLHSVSQAQQFII